MQGWDGSLEHTPEEPATEPGPYDDSLQADQFKDAKTAAEKEVSDVVGTKSQRKSFSKYDKKSEELKKQLVELGERKRNPDEIAPRRERGEGEGQKE